MATSSPGSVPSGSVVLSPASLLAALLDLLLPGSCGGCDAPVTGWCAGCAAQLGPPLWPVPVSYTHLTLPTTPYV